MLRSRKSLLALAICSLAAAMTLTGCGNIPLDISSSSHPGLDVAPAPQGPTELTPGDQMVITSNNLDMEAAKVFKQVTGLTIEPLRKSEDAELIEELEKEKNARGSGDSSSANAVASESKDDASDASVSGAGDAPASAIGTAQAGADAGSGQLMNNVSAAQSNGSAASTQSDGAERPLPVLGFQGQLKDEKFENLTGRYVEELRRKLPSGFIPFATGKLHEEEYVAVIKATDPYEPIRTIGTSSGSLFHNAGPDQIITKLKEWNVKYPLHVSEAYPDSCVAILDKVPDDVDSLARDVKKFAPGDGSASKNDFADAIRKREIFLWWD